MREVVVHMFITLDGVVQAPGGPDEDRSGGFEHGGWSVGYWDERMQEVVGAAMTPPFELLLGRGTYEIFAAHWPHTDDPPAELFNTTTKHVASTTLTSLDWGGSRLLGPDITGAVRELKAQDGPDLHTHGSPELVRTLLAHSLVDELRLMVFPLVLGSGKRIWGEGTAPGGLEVVRGEVSSTGVVIATYRTGAEIKGGSFALDEPSEEEVARRARA